MHAVQERGLLPFPRLTHSPLTAHAVVESRGAKLHKDKFPEMLERMPVLRQKLVNVMADRIRETTRADQQREKLMALGQPWAGLAHELNNPRAAAPRATDNLRQAILSGRTAALQLDKH